MYMNQLCRLCVFCVLAILPLTAEAQPLLFTFDSSNQGWLSADFGLPFPAALFQPSGGNPGGFIYSNGVNSYYDARFISPDYNALYYGSLYGGAISFDWRIPQPSPPINAQLSMFLSGDGKVVNFGPSPIFSSGQDWSHVSVPILGLNFKLGPEPVQSLMDVLSAFDGLGIAFTAPAGTPIAIDNVSFSMGSRHDPPLSGPGSSPTDPVLPTGVFAFSGSAGDWFDPPAASGFVFSTVGGSLFTYIDDFPAGFDSPFSVNVNGHSLGLFGPGQEVDFLSLVGHGVSTFSITGIQPAADPTNPLSFPVRLDFDTSNATFTMMPVPEPSSLALAAFGLAGLAARRSQKQSKE